VGKKQKNCDPDDPDDDHCGDYWDYVAYDPEHRLVLVASRGRGRSRTPYSSSKRPRHGWGMIPP
jgi:hypothetical protein